MPHSFGSLARAVINPFGFAPDLDPAVLERKYATPPSRFVTAGGMRFHIRERGAGPTIVLIHGQSAHLFLWEAAAELLARDHHVVSLDLPAHGLTGPDPQRRYSFAGLANSVHALVEALGLDRFALAGNSLGGAVSTQYALTHPEKLEALILLDGIGAPRSTEIPPAAFAAFLTPGIGDLATIFTPKWAVRAGLADTYGDVRKLSDAEVDRTYDLLRRRGNRVAQRQTMRKAMEIFDAARIATIATPTLLLWGDRDTWVTVKYGEWFRRLIPGAEMQIFPGVGHQPMAEAPAETADAMRAFLARQRTLSPLP